MGAAVAVFIYGGGKITGVSYVGKKHRTKIARILSLRATHGLSIILASITLLYSGVSQWGQW